MIDRGGRRRITRLATAVASAAVLLVGARVSPAADPAPPAAALTFSTYLGGSNSDWAQAAAFGPDGALWIAGGSYSRDLRGAAHAGTDGGDVVVLRLDPATHAVLSSAWIGGAGYDTPTAMAFGKDGAAFVAGETSYGVFPATTWWSATQAQNDFYGSRTFVARVLPDGSRFGWSGVLDSSRFSRVAGLATTQGGDPVVAGSGSDGVYVTRLSADGSGVVFTRRVAADGWAYAVAVEPNGNILVAGRADPTGLVGATRLLGTAGGGKENFLAELDATGASVLRTALLGESAVVSIAASAEGLLLLGDTEDPEFPAAPAAHGPPGDDGDAFLLRLNADWEIAGSVLFGGRGTEYYLSMAEAGGTIRVCGSTQSPDLPLVGAFQPLLGSSEDAFLAVFDAATLTPSFSTYLGGDARELGYGVAAAPDGSSWLVGATASSNFPVSSADQSGVPNGGTYDMFVARVVPPAAGAPPAAPLDPVADVLDAHSVRVGWSAGSADATTFVVFRRGETDGFGRVGVVSAPATTWTDTNLPADHAYSYAVQAVNDAGGSAASPVVEARTGSTLDARIDVGVVEFFNAGFDGSTRLGLRGRLSTNAASADGVFDPRREGIEWTMTGGPGSGGSLVIRARDRHWRKTRHGLRWTRRGARLDFDPRTGLFNLRTAGYGWAFWPDESSASRLRVTVGDDVGSVELHWRFAGPTRVQTR